MYMRNYQGDPGLFTAIMMGAKIFKAIKGRKKARAPTMDLPPQVRQPGGYPILQKMMPSRGSPFGLLSRAMRASPIARMETAAIQQYYGGQRFMPSKKLARDPFAGMPLGTPGEMMPKRKRMNVANPKALRRAIRRQSGFVKLARKALKGSGYRIVSGSSRRPAIKIQESGSGGVVVQK